MDTPPAVASFQFVDAPADPTALSVASSMTSWNRDVDALKPGDLIIYYPDAHHVGMYVGEGYVVHASTFGVPVAVVPVDKGGPYHSARRY